MKIVSVEQMRELDRRTIAERGIPGFVLMERAGRSVAGVVARICGERGWMRPRLLLIAGRGNNGGDAFAAARRLGEEGWEPQVWCTDSPDALRGDAAEHFRKMTEARVSSRVLAGSASWASVAEAERADIVVDGVLGTGVRGAVRGAAADAIACINRLSRPGLVVAIDVPSGLNADTGEAGGAAVKADVTVTMGLPKAGLIREGARDRVGSLEVADIGIPADFVAPLEGAECELIARADVEPWFPRRERLSHKGDYGRLLILSGAAGYSGAVALAARAALRAGTGLVSILTPRGIASTVAGLVPEAMVHPAAETSCGSLQASAWENEAGRGAGYDAILVGPGLARHEESGRLAAAVVAQAAVPVVLDADGLCAFAGRAEALARRACPLILTPHPGEMGRLLGISASDVQAERPRAVRDAASRSRAVVVLKGSGTLVAAPEGTPWINMTGNPGMATGGTGDVLAGLMAGLCAGGLDPFAAARAAVFAHGRAGDRAALGLSEAGITASDLVGQIPLVLRELAGR